MKNLRLNYRRVKRKLLANHLNIVRLAFIIVIVVALWGISSTLRSAVRNSFLYDGIASGYSFLFTPEDSIESFDGRTNVLLLGKAGTDENSAPELTDTIIVVSFDHKDDKSISMISVPRDIWVGDINDKINAAYMIGKEKSDQAGMTLSKSVVEEVVGIPIHYAFVVDFSVFEEVIDIIGGVEIEVERSFVDEKYPIVGLENDDCNGDPEYKCRYETVEFVEGTQTMDGETALKYSRSRQSTDPQEGTDLARAERQQKVIAAIREKMLSSKVVFAPRKLYSLWLEVNDKIETDLSNPQLALLSRFTLQSKSDISSNVIPEELLNNPPLTEEYNFLYVFTPTTDDKSWSDVHLWVSSVL